MVEIPGGESATSRAATAHPDPGFVQVVALPVGLAGTGLSASTTASGFGAAQEFRLVIFRPIGQDGERRQAQVECTPWGLRMPWEPGGIGGWAGLATKLAKYRPATSLRSR